MNFDGITILNRYRLSEQIGEGGMSYVYLAADLEKKDRKVVAKILKSNVTSRRTEDYIRFHSEATAISKLRHENIVEVFEVGEQDGFHFLVMEHIRGESLQDKLKSSKGFGIIPAVSIIRQLAVALEYIHSRGIVHRDLKPGNIMCIPEKKKNLAGEYKVKLIDFGLAQIKDFSEIKDVSEIVGTFSYMSPEQSGMIKQKVDERSDLYSLGIIFYRLLAGELPFEANDIPTLLHKHIATAPAPLSNELRKIPQIIEKIVFKLMEKEPEKRYQSAHGLMCDLNRFLDGDEEFLIGGDDRVIRLNHRTTMIGRKDDLELMVKRFSQAVAGNGGMVLVGGEAGSGKSRMIEEFRRAVVKEDRSCLEGRCFPGMSRTPYKPFRDALDHYMNIFGNYTVERKTEIRDKLKSSLGDLGGIILKLNPRIGEIVGDFPPLVELEPDRENVRFLIEVSRFFRTLAELEGGLALIVEDLHWADEGTLLLIGEILKDLKQSKLMIAANFRSNELPPGHRIITVIKEAREGLLPLEIVQLRLLTREDTEELISGLLYGKPDEIESINAFVYSKSKGNPFFTIEIIKQMVDDKAIRIENGEWVFDRDLLGRIQISSTLLDIIFNRIAMLNKKERIFLRWASLIGRKFSMDFLFRLAKELNPAYSEYDSVEVADNMVRLGILEGDQSEKGKIWFVHDRIRDVFEEQIPLEERQVIHTKIAAIIESTSDRNDKNVLFDLANHYYLSGQWDKALEFLIPAAEQAALNYANEDAIRYYSMAQELIEDAGLSESVPWIDCRINLGRLNLNIGRYDESISLFQSVLPLVEQPLEKAKIYREVCTAFLKKGDKPNCEENGRLGLKMLGEYLPVKRGAVLLSIVSEFLRRFFHDVFHFLYINREKWRARNKLRYDKDKLIVWFYITLNWIYIINDLEKFVRCSIRMYNLAESRLGKSKELGMGKGAYAALVMAIPFFKPALRIHEQALKMRRELGDDWGIAQSLQWLGYCYQWMGEYQESQKYFELSRQGFRRIGDIWEQGITEGGMDMNGIYLAEYDKSLEFLHSYLKISEYSKNYFGMSSVYVDYIWMNSERGDFVLSNSWAEKCRKLLERNPMPLSECNYNIYLGEQFLVREDYNEAVKHLEHARTIHEKNSLMDQYVNQLYPDLAEAYLGMYFLEVNHQLKKRYRKMAVKTIAAAFDKNRKWVTHMGKTCRVQARIFAVLGNNTAAERMFNRAVKWDSDLGRNYELGRDFLDFGVFLRNIGRARESRAKIESAYRLFKSFHSRELANRAADILGIREDSTGGFEKFQAKHRLTSIVQMIQSISSILNMDKLLENIVSKMVEYTGAQRGIVFLKNEDTGDLDIRAKKNMDGSADLFFSSHVVQQVFQKGITMVSGNAAQDEEFYEFMSVVNYHLKSILCVPIRRHDHVIGVCYLDNPLSSSVFGKDDIELIEVILGQAAIAIENATLYSVLETRVQERSKELNIAYDTIKQDLRLAKRVQESMLPSSTIDLPGIDSFVRYIPMSEVGGDIYDVTQLGEKVIRIFVADATGHGIQAALMTMLIKSEYEQVKATVSSPAELLEVMNSEIYNTYRALTVFFTGIVCDIDLANRRIVYASAGHPPQFLISGKETVALGSTGMLCGSFPSVKYGENGISFHKGDKLLLFTDGLFEEFDTLGRELGIEGIDMFLKDDLSRNPDKPIHALCKELIFLMEDHLGGGDRNDDVTLIGLEFIK